MDLFFQSNLSQVDGLLPGLQDSFRLLGHHPTGVCIYVYDTPDPKKNRIVTNNSQKLIYLPGWCSTPT